MIAQDLWITLLLIIFIMQYVIMSSMLYKRGIAAESIVACASPVLCIWVLFWPVYQNSLFIPYSMVFIALPLVAAQWPYAFMQQLKRSWTIADFGFLGIITLVLNLSIATLLFLIEPAFGFSIALCLCLASSTANMLDKQQYGRLFLAFNPQQTFLGHLSLIIMVSVLCSWSLHIYFSVPQMATWPIAVLTGLAASLGRALAPHVWSNTGMLTGMAMLLWLF